MQALDWICLAVVVISVLLGAWRGLLYEAVSVAAWVVAFLVARWVADPVARMLPLGDADEALRYAAAFALVFIVVAFAGGLFAALARRAAGALGVRPVDRVFGTCFGVARAALLLLAVAVVVRLGAWEAEPWWRDSLSGPWLDVAVQHLAPLLPERLAHSLAA